MKNDAETTKIINEADHILALTQSEGWAIVRGKLDAKILDLQNIHNIETTDTNKMLVEIMGRKLAVEILYGWMKNDIYGFVAQQASNNSGGRVEESPDIIDLGSEKE